MFRRGSSLQNHLAATTGASLLVGLFVGLVLLFNATSALRNSAVLPAQQEVTLGPLQLMSLTAAPAGDGATKVELDLSGGVVWYALFWLLLGAAVGYLMWRAKYGDGASSG